MILSWMLYALATGLAFAGAAAAAESSTGSFRRVGWIAAIVATVVAPVALPLLLPGREPAIAENVSPVSSAEPGVAATAHTDGGLRAEEPAPVNARFIFAAWGTASAMLGLLLIVANGRAARDASGWRAREVGRRHTLVSERFGPAVIGFFPPRVVVPEWALALSPEHQLLIVRHEQEHVDAHDQHLVLAALVALVLVPWNLALWLQFIRLRAAIELDCDARVARGAANPANYAQLLLVASGHQQRGAGLGLALLRPVSSLMRRVEALTVRPRRSARHAVVGTIATLCCLAAMGAMPRPAHVSDAFGRSARAPSMPTQQQQEQPQRPYTLTVAASERESPAKRVAVPSNRATHLRIALTDPQMRGVAAAPSVSNALQHQIITGEPPGLPTAPRVGGRGGVLSVATPGRMPAENTITRVMPQPDSTPVLRVRPRPD